LIGFRILNSSAATDDHGIDYAAIAGFTRAIQVIRQDYVDRSAVTYKKLTYAALHAMLEQPQCPSGYNARGPNRRGGREIHSQHAD
jgi:hypothetical protein